MATINLFGNTSLPFEDIAQVTTANTNTDGSGTVVSVKAGAGRGSTLNRVDVKAAGITTAGMIRFYLHDGANSRLVGELPVAAVAAIGGGVKSFEGTWTPGAGSISIPNGWTLKAATEKGETFNLFASGTDYQS